MVMVGWRSGPAGVVLGKIKRHSMGRGRAERDARIQQRRKELLESLS